MGCFCLLLEASVPSSFPRGFWVKVAAGSRSTWSCLISITKTAITPEIPRVLETPLPGTQDKGQIKPCVLSVSNLRHDLLPLSTPFPSREVLHPACPSRASSHTVVLPECSALGLLVGVWESQSSRLSSWLGKAFATEETLCNKAWSRLLLMLGAHLLFWKSAVFWCLHTNFT